MVIDTSVIIAILTLEPEASAFARAIERSQQTSVSAASIVEAGIVLVGRYDEVGRSMLAEFLGESQAVTVPVTARQTDMAIAAFLRYGKGRHPAGLNFGDCFSFALAKDLDQPLLFKGCDFSRTDIAVADC